MDSSLPIIALIAGAVIGWLISFSFYKSKSSSAISKQEFDSLNQRLLELDKQKVILETEIKNWKSNFETADVERNKYNQMLTQTTAELSSANTSVSKLHADFTILKDESHKTLEEIKTQLNNEKAKSDKYRTDAETLNKINAKLEETNRQLAEQVANIEKGIKEQYLELSEKLKSDFSVISNKLFEEKSEKFTVLNKDNLANILNPLNDKLKGFEELVNKKFNHETEISATLSTEIKNLMTLNQQISAEANNLTKAIKGDKQVQGSWGEMVLESILTGCGLRKGEEFFVQESFDAEGGGKLRPDVIVKLPDNKCIIIDSKVSLVAFTEYCAADDSLKPQFLKQHLDSVKRHIKELSEKDYTSINKLETLDYTIMFVNPEPAFNVAIQEDKELFNFALNKNILIVSPSALFAMVKTIAHIWKTEKQNQNVKKIAEEAGKMYDKFVLFLKEIEELGKKIESAQSTYTKVRQKLTGGGNLIKKAEELKKLGAKTTKHIPPELLDEAGFESAEEVGEEEQDLEVN